MVNASFWNGRKVFLTGHTGFKGSWLSIWLHDMGAEVLGFGLEPNTEPSLFRLAEIENIVQSVIGDVRDLQLLKDTMVAFNPDIVIHMAAQPLVRESYENPVETYEINVMGTVNVLESVRHIKSVKAVLNVTTDKVYENKEWVWGYRENDILGGYDPYSNSKACSEFVTSAYIQSFFNIEKYDEHGVALATARAGNVIGGGDWAKDRLIPDILKAIEKDEEITIRNPDALRPWQHVIEPLAGYLMLLERLYLEGVKYSGPWNFGPESSSYKSVGWIANKIATELDGRIDIIKDLENYHETQLLKLDNTKSKFDLGWQSKLDLEETLVLIAEWYKVYQNKGDILSICKKQLKVMVN